MVQTPSVPPVEKLPLAARKNIRDEFDSKIAEYTKTVSDLLKKPYKLEVDFNQFYAYGAAADNWVKSSPGTAAAQYFESFVTYLKRFTDDGEYTDAVEAFNELVSESCVSIEAGGPGVVYSDCSIDAGTFEINFDPKSPGTNVDYACREMPKRFDEALYAKSQETLPMIARRSIRDDYENNKEEILKSCKDALLGATVKLVVDYDAIWNTIVAAKKVNKEVDPQDKARSFGSTIKGYFEGFAYQMKNKLEGDDMMVEGFTDAVSTMEIVLQVVPEGSSLKDTYSEIEIVAGQFILRTTPKNFGTNVDYVARGVVDLL